MNYKISFNEINFEYPIKGVLQKAFVYEHRILRLVEYSTEMPLHWCEKGHIGYVLDGEMEIEFEKACIVFKKGDGIFIPGGKEHAHRGKPLTNKVIIIFVEDI